MKTTLLLLFITVTMLAPEQTPLKFQLNVDGLEDRNVQEDGLRPVELTHLTIDVQGGAADVNEFQIVHARGQSPLSYARDVKGNDFDLTTFRALARAGDRIVISIKSVLDENNAVVATKDLTMVIPIK